MNLIERVKRHMYTHMYQNGNYSSTKMPLVLGWCRAEWWGIVQQVEKFVLNTKMVSTSYQPNRIFTGTMYAGSGKTVGTFKIVHYIVGVCY